MDDAAALHWSAPDSSVPQPSNRFVAVPEATGPPRLLLPLTLRLRRRTPTAILDAGFSAVRFRFVRAVAVSLVILGPLVVVPTVFSASEQFRALDAAQQQGSTGQVFGGGLGTDFSSIGVWGWLATIGSYLATGLVGVAMAGFLGGWVVGRDPSFGDILRLVGRASPAVVVAALVTLPLKGLGFLVCLIGALVPMVWFMLISPVIALERAGPFAAIKRSFRLINRRFMPALGQVVLCGLIVTVLGTVASAIVAALSATDSATWLVWLAGSLTMVLRVLTACLHGAWATLLYFDIRTRSEGIDLEMRIQALEMNP